MIIKFLAFSQLFEVTNGIINEHTSFITLVFADEETILTIFTSNFKPDPDIEFPITAGTL